MTPVAMSSTLVGNLWSAPTLFTVLLLDIVYAIKAGFYRSGGVVGRAIVDDDDLLVHQ